MIECLETVFNSQTQQGGLTAMIGTRHYERIMTFPAYVSCRKSLTLLALLLGILPVLLYIMAMLLAASPSEAGGPRIEQTAAVVLTVFLAIIALICPLTAAVLNKVFVEKNIGRPPFRFMHSEPEEETEEEKEEPQPKPFEAQFTAMCAILFAISDATALFGLVLGILGRGWGYAIPFFVFSLIFTIVLYLLLKNQLFSLLSQHFDLIEGGGKAKLTE
jgi:hypothetical protein